MRKILLVGGDSFSDQNYVGYPKDMITWPTLLAEKLDMKLVCVAQSGGGNEQIYSSILDWICENGPDNVGMVIAGWSKCERMDWEISLKRGWCNTRLSPKGNIFSWIRKSIRNFYSLQILCDHFNIPLKQFQMISLFAKYVAEYTIHPTVFNTDYKSKRLDCVNYILQSPQFNLIDESKFIGWPIFDEQGGFVVSDVVMYKNLKSYDKLAGEKVNLEYTISDQDFHPNQKGHNLLSEFIYENL